MESSIKTVIIKKKGRKFFECVIGGYQAKLVINGVSKDLELDRVVKLLVNDLSERTKFGTALKFEPLEILDDRDAEAVRKEASDRKYAEKVLTSGERAARKGSWRGQDIADALRVCPKIEEMAERLAALKVRVHENELSWKAQVLEERSDAVRGKKKALFPASKTPQMGVPVLYRKRLVVFEFSGNFFRIDGGHSELYSDLVGHEEEQGSYCYYREADEVEASTHAECEAPVASVKKIEIKFDADHSINFVAGDGVYSILSGTEPRRSSPGCVTLRNCSFGALTVEAEAAIKSSVGTADLKVAIDAFFFPVGKVRSEWLRGAGISFPS